MTSQTKTKAKLKLCAAANLKQRLQLMRADIKAFVKAAETFLIFALQMHSNIVSLNKHSVGHSFKTAEANRETVSGNP